MVAFFACSALAAVVVALLLLQPAQAQDSKLTLTLENDVTAIEPGQAVDYRLTLRNEATSAAAVAELRVTLPPGLEFRAATLGGQETAPGSGIVVWPAFNVDAGGQTTRTISARAALPLPASITSVTVAAQASVADEASPPTAAASTSDPLVAASIAGVVWHDLNGNGGRDAGEPGIESLSIQLSTPAVALPPRQTDGNGAFHQPGLGAGEYTVNVTGSALSAFSLRTGQRAPATVPLATGAQAQLAFGYARPARIAGQIWRKDAAADPAAPLADVRVLLRTEAGTPVAVQRTGASGAYQFVDLAPGRYVVALDTAALPAGFAAVFESDSTRNQQTTINLLSGASRTAVDFGLAFTGQIQPAIVWRDTNQNGTREADESGLAGITVESRFAGADARFDTPDDALASQKTAADGSFAFSTLAPGRYRLRIVGNDWNPAVGVTADPDGELDGETLLTIEAGAASGPIRFGYGRHDLMIRQEAEPAQATTGDLVRFRLHYGNAGAVEGGQVVLRATIPEFSRFDATASSPGWSCPDRAAGGTRCELMLGAVPVGAAGEATLAVHVDPTMPADASRLLQVAEIVELAPGWLDVAPRNNRSELAVPVAAAPELTVDLDDGSGSRAPGEIILYTIRYANQGNQAAAAVRLVLRVPASTRFDAANSAENWQCANLVAVGEECTLNIGDVAAGAEGVVPMALALAPAVPVNFVAVNATITLEDSAGHRDSAVEVTPVTAAPDLKVTIEPSTEPIIRGAPIRYRIRYANDGNQDAIGVLLVSEVPSYTRFVAAESAPGWDCADGSPPAIQCILAIGSLPAGATGDAWFVASVDPAMPDNVTGIDYRTVIVGSGVEQDVSNNQAGGVIDVSLPSAIELLRFAATPQADGTIRVLWETGAEQELRGFLLYRARRASWQEAERLTPALITGLGSPSAGATYTIIDEIVEPDAEHYYWLQELAANNATVVYGPIQTRRLPSGSVSGEAIFLPLVRQADADAPGGRTTLQPMTSLLGADGRFATLTALLRAAALNDLVDGDGPLTLFAPTDAAFADLEASAPGTLSRLQADPYGGLTRLLLYHLHAGDLEGLAVGDQLLTSLEGAGVPVHLAAAGTLTIGESRMAGPPLDARNGRVLPIDTVLLPAAR